MALLTKYRLTWLILASFIAITPQKSAADCNSPEAQEILRWLETESEVRSFQMGRCGPTMIQYFTPRVIARRNNQRNQAEQRNGTRAYQLQYRVDGNYFAGPNFLSRWDCSDARWAYGAHSARCVEVTIYPVN